MLFVKSHLLEDELSTPSNEKKRNLPISQNDATFQIWWWLGVCKKEAKKRSKNDQNGRKFNMVEMNIMVSTEFGLTQKFRGKWNCVSTTLS